MGLYSLSIFRRLPEKKHGQLELQSEYPKDTMVVAIFAAEVQV